jgi:D-3-phosphoglycerate dehydrogenase
MGKSFAKKLRGFDWKFCYDIQENVGDANAKQVSLEELQQKSVLSLHIPWTRKLIKWLTLLLLDAFRSLSGFLPLGVII